MDKFINKVIMGDCLEVMKGIPDNSIDSIVTDPPAGISFMGKSWDTDKGGRDNWIKWMQEVATECKRVLKPGGHAFVWTIPRTSHWTATAWENAGFEIRDVVAHIFGSGFPKSLNIGKAVDKLQGNEREVTGSYKVPDIKGDAYGTMNEKQGGSYKNIEVNKIKGTSEWEGWGTALKPAREDWILMRKPLDKGLTIAENCLKWGTGGINIDDSRVGTGAKKWSEPKGGIWSESVDNGAKLEDNPLGRFPANLIHDNSEEVRECFPDAGKGNGKGAYNYAGREYDNKDTSMFNGDKPQAPSNFNDSGNASRFFKSIIYQSKAPRSERLLNGFDCAKIEVWKNKDENMEVAVSLTRAILDLLAKNLNTVESGGNITAIYPKDSISTIRTTTKKITELKTWNSLMHSPINDFIVDVFSKKMDGGNLVGYAENSNELMTRIGIFQEKVGLATEDVKNAIYQSLLKISEQNAWQEAASHHPTHKPIALMEYLIKMVTKPGGIVLDPFAGSGSTLVSAKQNGYKYIGIELTEEYIPIIEARLLGVENNLFKDIL